MFPFGIENISYKYSVLILMLLLSHLINRIEIISTKNPIIVFAFYSFGRQKFRGRSFGIIVQILFD